MDLFGDAPVTLEPLAGGWSGETFLADVGGGERSVVRIYGRPSDRGDAAAEVDAALLQLVRGLLPVPEVREVRRADPEAGTPGLLVTEVVAGVRGDLLLPGLDPAGQARLGAALGSVAATLAGMPQLRSGVFVDADLRVEPYDVVLPGWVAEHEPRLLGFDADDLAGLRAVAEEAQAVLDRVARVALVHSDLNPKNVLVDPDSLAVTAVLDWEFAHAGHPFTDLGNLLRFDREPDYPDYVAAILRAWEQHHGTGADEARHLARCADLAALVELATRAGQNPVATAARARLLAVARTGDVHAVEDDAAVG